VSHPAASKNSTLLKRGKPRCLLAQAALCLVLTATAYADFYKYTDADGVETFTNTPTNSGAVRVLREAKPKAAAKSVAKSAPTREAGSAAPAKVEELQSTGKDALLPVQGVVTSKYGWRHDPIDGSIRHHNGVDIAVPTGTRVKVIAAGRVVESGLHGGYGNLVAVEHDDGTISMYGHNSRLEVSVGDRVEAGQTVALSGSTGRSTGPHLHFELWKNGNNVTAAYLKDGAGFADVAGGIRTYLHSDGSLVFTNLN